MSVSKLHKQRGQILDDIMRYHRENLPKQKRQVSFEDLRAFAIVTPPAVDFCAALQQPGVSLIAECKKASPSKGLIVPNYNARELASEYIEGGASAISVLTDGRHFQGTLEDLRNVKELSLNLKPLIPYESDQRHTLGIPILRKDFIFDPYQIYEARVAGADAVLLIVSVLSDNDLKSLLKLTHKLGMDALIETHTEEDIKRTLALNPRIIGINNRNLQTFDVDFENTARLRKLIPAGILVVGESGLKNTADVMAMKKIGVDAILVGETLARDKDRKQLTHQFVKAGRDS